MKHSGREMDAVVLTSAAALPVLDARDRNRRRAECRIVGLFAAVAAVVAFAFGWSLSLDPDDPADLWLSGVQAVVTSLMISVPLVGLEIVGGRTQMMRRLRRAPFWAYFLLKLALYATLIVVAIQLGRLMFHPLNPQSFRFDREFFEGVAGAAAMSLVANAVVEVGRLIGFRELRRVLAGRYLRPRRERRVFLMIDLKNSTAIAEQLGDERFHELLNAFFDDVADAAFDHGAEIHKYVGDEAILTWPEEEALRDARCALCPLGLARRIGRSADEYRRRFGLVPSFRAAIHGGEVVAGEMGALKREITFIGDTVNITSRLMGVARDSKRDIVISGDLATRLQLPDGLAAVPLGTVGLRGKERPLPVVALEVD